jgi:hypothetical protein
VEYDITTIVVAQDAYFHQLKDGRVLGDELVSQSCCLSRRVNRGFDAKELYS